FLTFTSKRPSLGYLIAFGVIATAAVNISYVSYVWLSYRSDYEAIKASFMLLRQGSFVLVASSTKNDPSMLLTDAPMARAPTLAVYYAKAFVTSLYTVPGTHAVEVRPDFKRLNVNNTTESYEPPSLRTLEIIARGGAVPGAPGYIRNWTRDFDYVY